MTTDALLLRIALALEGIREDLRASQRRDAGDDPAARLLPLIHEFAADRVFAAGELVAHAALPEHASLRLAIAHAVGLEHQARRLGKLFDRIEGVPIGGFRVERVKRDGAGTVWSLARLM